MHQVDKFLAAVHIQFGIDMFGVRRGGFARYNQSIANVGDRSPTRQQPEHLKFARGEFRLTGQFGHTSIERRFFVYLRLRFVFGLRRPNRLRAFRIIDGNRSLRGSRGNMPR